MAWPRLRRDIERNNVDDQGRRQYFAALTNLRVYRIVDIVVAALLPASALLLQTQAYELALVFEVLPFWVVPTAMIVLGIVLIVGFRRQPDATRAHHGS